MIIRPSQKAVLEWLKEHPGSTPQQVGDALYDTYSMCSSKNQGHDESLNTATDRVRRKPWAAQILNSLKKKGLVVSGEEGWTVIS